MTAQKILDQRRDQIRLFDMQHVPRARDANYFNAGYDRPERGIRAVASEPRQILGLLTQQQQERRPNSAPAGFRILALVQNRIDPAMASVPQKMHASVG